MPISRKKNTENPYCLLEDIYLIWPHNGELVGIVAIIHSLVFSFNFVLHHTYIDLCEALEVPS